MDGNNLRKTSYATEHLICYYFIDIVFSFMFFEGNYSIG